MDDWRPSQYWKSINCHMTILTCKNCRHHACKSMLRKYCKGRKKECDAVACRKRSSAGVLTASTHRSSSLHIWIRLTSDHYMKLLETVVNCRIFLFPDRDINGCQRISMTSTVLISDLIPSDCNPINYCVRHSWKKTFQKSLKDINVKCMYQVPEPFWDLRMATILTSHNLVDC